VHLRKPKTASIKINRIAREVIPIAWPNDAGGCDHLAVKPADIGLKEAGVVADLAYPLYIQQHALKRLKERIGIVPGMAQHAL